MGLRILIVEDEAFIAMSLEMELKKVGFEICRTVATGEKAVLSAEKHLPDVVLMDIRLAGKIDGIEAAEQIKARSDVPIIFMTGYPDKDVEERARKVHPAGYFIKPVQVSRLVELLNTRVG